MVPCEYPERKTYFASAQNGGHWWLIFTQKRWPKRNSLCEVRLCCLLSIVRQLSIFVENVRKMSCHALIYFSLDSSLTHQKTQRIVFAFRFSRFLLTVVYSWWDHIWNVDMKTQHCFHLESLEFHLTEDATVRFKQIISRYLGIRCLQKNTLRMH